MQLMVMADQSSPDDRREFAMANGDGDRSGESALVRPIQNLVADSEFIARERLNNGPLQIVSHSSGASVELLPNPMGVPVLASNGPRTMRGISIGRHIP